MCTVGCSVAKYAGVNFIEILHNTPAHCYSKLVIFGHAFPNSCDNGILDHQVNACNNENIRARPD